jgi:hypothetical protein
MIEAYNRYQAQTRGSAEAQQNYEFLSEFTHANGSALLSYYVWKQNGRVLSFTAPALQSPASFINVCLVDILQFIDDLLAIAGEGTVRSVISAVLRQMILAAKRAGFL